MDKYNEGILKDIVSLKPVIWLNPKAAKATEALRSIDLSFNDIIEAERRLERFAPLIKKLFPELQDGIIESPLVPIDKMKESLEEYYSGKIKGSIYLKCDSHMKIAGSVKARGGIYEVIKHAEKLALEAGLISESDDYSVMSGDKFRRFFSEYKVAVGSTGNLGLSIGIISSALGFNVTVHMSRDAKQWKKELLRSKGVNVIEYEEDYSKAVEEGRCQCQGDSKAYFVDDENSKDLFLGYSVAGLRLEKQLEEMGISAGEKHRLHLYLPCGVGGAPGGIAFGVKHVFGDSANCYFVEPTHSPCMILGLITEKFNNIHVREYGIDNITEADGLAVGVPSGLVSRLAEKLISGEYTIEDEELFKLTALLKDSEDIKVEPSAAAGLLGPVLNPGEESDIHIVWATGGLFLPEKLFEQAYTKGKALLT
jgi:D-serine dehydratase